MLNTATGGSRKEATQVRRSRWQLQQLQNIRTSWPRPPLRRAHLWLLFMPDDEFHQVAFIGATEWSSLRNTRSAVRTKSKWRCRMESELRVNSQGTIPELISPY